MHDGGGNEEVADALSSRRRTSRGLAMTVLIFASFMDLMDTTVVNVALPSIQRNLHASPASLEWIVSGYTLAFAVVLITGGRLGDIFGRQRLFLIGVAGFTLASLAAAVAPGPGTLVAARLFQGAFGALMVPQVLASVQALYAPSERGVIFGIFGAIVSMAAVAGPLVGGALVSSNAFGIDWRSIFIINLPVGVVLFVAAVLVVPNTRSSHALRLDLPGVAVVTAALFLLVYPLVEGRQEGWPGWIWAMLAASPFVFGAFVVYQRRRAATTGSPLVPMNLFSSRGFSAGVITQLTFSAGLTGFFLVLTLYLQLGLHFSAIRTGVTFLPFSIGTLIGSGLAVPLAAKLGKPLVSAGGVIAAGSVIWVRHVVELHAGSLSNWDLVWPMLVGGLGLVFVFIPLVDLSVATVDVRDAGAGSGVYNTFQQVGSALGVAVIGVVFFDNVGNHLGAGVFRDALGAAEWVTIAIYLASAAASLFLPRSAALRPHLEPGPELAESVSR